MNDKNQWKEPVNLGSVINTDGDEMSPFIHFDGKTLYFASDGRVGMGGFDLYITRMNDDSTWSEPKNLGYPINTYNDEMGLIIEAGGQKAYYSSVRDKSNGKDIFSFDLYEAARPDPVSYIKGKVYDKETGRLLKADYELINLSTGKILIRNPLMIRAASWFVCLQDIIMGSMSASQVTCSILKILCLKRSIRFLNLSLKELCLILLN